MRALGSDAHILDVLATMWTTAFAFFDQAVSSPACVIGGSLDIMLRACEKRSSLRGHGKQLST
eukprot:3459162-Pleurochrysis_carterae.AAC.2